MASQTVVGIMLVRNEDVFLEKSIENVLGFCDTLKILDNRSTDQTLEIASRIESQHSHVQLFSVRSPEESHEHIQSYAGTDTWVFGVDGDEIYDPYGLRRFKARLQSGEYSEWWQVFGNVLNCIDIDFEHLTGRGYLAPPSRSITKLFNFAAIEEWGGPTPERLHGGVRHYRDGFGDQVRLNLQNQVAWEEADLRCLHTCFMRRSSSERVSRYSPRENIAEINERSSRSFFKRSVARGKALLYGGQYKKSKYRRGDLVDKDIRSFF